MATTVTAADLTVTISESYELNGVPYGNTPSTTFSAKGKVIQRVMNIATTFTDIFHTASADGRGTIVTADWAYFRITNLDDTNYLRLRFYDGGNSIFVLVEAGGSFFMMNPDMAVFEGGTTFTSFNDITQIAAQAPIEACDVEVLMVTS